MKDRAVRDLRKAFAVVVIVLAVALVPARRAEAATFRLGLAANYWFVQQGVFNVDFAVTVPVASFLSVGGRFGGILVTGSPTIGIPVDLLIHIPIEKMYLEGMAGPWIFFEGRALNAHVGVGFGLNSGPFTFGIEAGYLDPRAMIGARFGYRF